MTANITSPKDWLTAYSHFREKSILTPYYSSEENISPVHVSVKNMSSIEMSPRKDDPTTPSSVI